MRLLIALAYSNDDDNDDRSDWLALNITFFCDHLPFWDAFVFSINIFLCQHTDTYWWLSCKSVNFENSHCQWNFNWVYKFKKNLQKFDTFILWQKESSILLNQLFRQFNEILLREFDLVEFVEFYIVYETSFLARRQFLGLLKAFGYQLLVDSRLSFARLQRNSEILDLMQRFIALDDAKSRDPNV